MASIFSHAMMAATIGTTFPGRLLLPRVWVLGMLSAALPDADVIAFSFGIPYEHVLGHRGITHSLLFALLWGGALTPFCLQRGGSLRAQLTVWAYLSLCTASHGVLDALTNGGRGVAFFAPFENSRYFFPWRPILVAPLGASNFFSAWGWEVVKNELLYLWVPAGIFVGIRRMLTRVRRPPRGLS